MTAVVNRKIQALCSLVLDYELGIQDLRSSGPLCLSYSNSHVAMHGFHAIA